MRKVVLLSALGLLAVLGVAAMAFADGGKGSGGSARLDGYQEVVGGPGPTSTGSVSTIADGRFRAEVRQNPLRIHYVLKYEDMQGGAVTQAHIHFAQRHVGGGVIAFLCGGDTKPTACPTPGGRVEGDIAAADIIGPADQGIDSRSPTGLMEAIRAIRAGAVYANVHSTVFPEGEIRGQLGGGGDRDRDD